MAQNSNVCRLCLSVNVLMVPLAGTPVQRVYENLIKTALPTAAKCPVVACYLCHAELLKCHTLTLRALKAHRLLEAILKKYPKGASNLAALLGDKANSLRASLSISPVDNIDSTSLNPPVVVVYKSEPCLLQRVVKREKVMEKGCSQIPTVDEGNNEAFIDDVPSTSHDTQLQDLKIKIEEEPWGGCSQLPTAVDGNSGLFEDIPSASHGLVQDLKIEIKEEPLEGSPQPPIDDEGNSGAFINDYPSTSHGDQLQDLKIEIKEEPWEAPSSPELKVMPPIKVYIASKRQMLEDHDVKYNKKRRMRDDTIKCKILKELINKKNKMLRIERRRNMTIKNKLKSKQMIDFNRIKNETGKLLTKMQSKRNHTQWTEEEKKFCTSLFFKYPAAYNHLRKAGIVLAAKSTIERWSKVDAHLSAPNAPNETNSTRPHTDIRTDSIPIDRAEEIVSIDATRALSK